MASSLLALIDDIASLLDDVSVLTKVAAKKTAGVLGDDLALNAQQVSGIQAECELPVVWAVVKGSVLNKLILVPVALAELVAQGLAGLFAGGLALVVWSAARRLWPAKAAAPAEPAGPHTLH